jgi:hypothetical protein
MGLACIAFLGSHFFAPLIKHRVLFSSINLLIPPRCISRGLRLALSDINHHGTCHKRLHSPRLGRDRRSLFDLARTHTTHQLRLSKQILLTAHAQWRLTTATFARPRTPSFSSRHVASVSSLECKDVCPRRRGSLSSLALCLSGMSARRACADGLTASPGAPAVSLEVS